MNMRLRIISRGLQSDFPRRGHVIAHLSTPFRCPQHMQKLALHMHKCLQVAHVPYWETRFLLDARGRGSCIEPDMKPLARQIGFQHATRCHLVWMSFLRRWFFFFINDGSWWSVTNSPSCPECRTNANIFRFSDSVIFVLLQWYFKSVSGHKLPSLGAHEVMAKSRENTIVDWYRITFWSMIQNQT